jgi:RNA polymerase sigma factor (sigma-70 family)
MQNEKLLVKKILSGNKNAFKELVELYEKLVAHIVFGMIKNRLEREDLCQEIFLKIFVNLNSFKFKSKLSTWIGRIAYNECLNYYSRKRIKIVEDFGYNKDEENQNDQYFESHKSRELPPVEKLSREEIKDFLQQEIEQLPVKFRTIILLYHIDELSYREIMEITNLSLSNLKVSLFRGRKILREQMLKKYKLEELWP